LWAFGPKLETANWMPGPLLREPCKSDLGGDPNLPGCAVRLRALAYQLSVHNLGFHSRFRGRLVVLGVLPYINPFPRLPDGSPEVRGPVVSHHGKLSLCAPF